ncbi:MAG: transglutaminase-like domain-containing protein [Capsulimonadaceae bacterium]|nr:transglutaminase-like domain-containing protein [Capsulimonadaceae bacterium]
MSYPTNNLARRAVTLAVCLFLAAACLQPGRADPFAPRVTIDGSLKTSASFTKTFVCHVPSGLHTLVISLPVARSCKLGGWYQSIGDFVTTASPPPSRRSTQTDAAGNVFHVLEYDSPLEGDVLVTQAAMNVAIETDLDRILPSTPFPLAPLPASIQPFVRPSNLSQAGDAGIVQYASVLTRDCSTEAQATENIARWTVANLTYTEGRTVRKVDAITTLIKRAGQCRGYSNAFVALARAAGIPARVVTGCTLAGEVAVPLRRDGRAKMTVSVPNGAHAWVELWYPGYGWIPYDPQTTMGFVDSHHVRFCVVGPSDEERPLVEWSSAIDRNCNVRCDESVAGGSLTDRFDVHCVTDGEPDGRGRILLERIQDDGRQAKAPEAEHG